MKRHESRRQRKRRMTRAILNAVGVAGWMCAAGVHAQSSVTLYGLVDAGIQYRTHADGQHSAVNLQNYGVLPSQVGLTGTEDLGSGLQAIFRLEQGINTNDGTATVPGNAFFRGAYVGLRGKFGTLTVGRQFSVLFDRTVFYDPLLYAGYGGQGVLMPLTANFIDNSVKFNSVDYGGFSADALAAAGGVAGNSRSGRVLEIGAQYSGNGYGVSAALHRAQGTASVNVDTSGLQQTIGTLATHWDMAKLSLYGGAERQTGSLAPSKTVAWGGARYQFDPFFGLAGGIYKTWSPTPTIGHPTLFIASGAYALSKRTVAYLNLGYSRNSSQSSQPVYEYDSTALNGASQFSTMVGMYHTF